MWSEGGNLWKECLSFAPLGDDNAILWKLILEEDEIWEDQFLRVWLRYGKFWVGIKIPK